MDHESRHIPKPLLALAVSLTITLIVNAYLAIRLAHHLDRVAPAPPGDTDLPCRAIPTRFVRDDPVCAQKLLDAMNVTKVRILGSVSELP